MPRNALLLAAFTLATAPLLRADDAPEIEHQPSICTVAGKPMALCGAISDDAMVAKARLYFRHQKDKFFSYVEMAFTGLEYCGTLPGARAGKAKAVEYYIWAIDDAYNIKRTSTFNLPVQSEDVCGFAPIERDAGRAAAITVHATHKDQGKKLSGEFDPTGVTFVPSR
ncbi:MAG: hypothetical protein KJ067_18050 [Vicinamibacteria bacterium]|jgi:hypothetical protein|nr:hypothetical protein [Vicinamibacteria bacterium]